MENGSKCHVLKLWKTTEIWLEAIKKKKNFKERI